MSRKVRGRSFLVLHRVRHQVQVLLPQGEQARGLAAHDGDARARSVVEAAHVGAGLGGGVVEEALGDHRAPAAHLVRQLHPEPDLLEQLGRGHTRGRVNASERALRRVVTGRKNWLFCGSDAGGTRAAILYSIVATCKAHAIDVWAYLKDVLERIPTHPDRRRAELLPRPWQAARAATAG